MLQHPEVGCQWNLTNNKTVVERLCPLLLSSRRDGEGKHFSLCSICTTLRMKKHTGRHDWQLAFVFQPSVAHRTTIEPCTTTAVKQTALTAINTSHTTIRRLYNRPHTPLTLRPLTLSSQQLVRPWACRPLQPYRPWVRWQRWQWSRLQRP